MLIYEPQGKAREYSPFALNHYSGCDHGCTYCYVPAMRRRFNAAYKHEDVKPRDIILKLEKELKTKVPDKQILLSFTCDPYCQADVKIGLTRDVLTVLLKYGCKVAVLTKGGARCLRDLDIFKKYGENIKIGATLTFDNPSDSLNYEPGAALPDDRLSALKKLNAENIKTFVSFEPVIKSEQSLALIKNTLPYVGQYKVGRWNHASDAKKINWPEFLKLSVSILRAAKKQFYIKTDLAKYAEEGFLRAEEINADSLALN